MDNESNSLKKKSWINLRVQEDHSLLCNVEVDSTRLVAPSLFDLLRLGPEHICPAQHQLHS